MGSEAHAVEVAIVVPTFNETDNILVLVGRLHDILDNYWRWEMIVVDDNSRDGTAAVVEAAALAGQPVRCIRRIGRRGLSTAVIEGCLATAAPLVIVMDADLQHDEAVIPAMLEHLANPACDLVVATRYAEGGSTGEWSGIRMTGSKLATWLARRVTSTEMSDPMSGFFGIRRSVFLQIVPRLSGAGFKILLDIAASAPRRLRVAEVPYTFRLRLAGESKLGASAVFDYLGMIVEKRSNGWVPARFALFCATGALGVIVHMLALFTMNMELNVDFDSAVLGAVVVAMTFNFILNNEVTYGDRRLQGGGRGQGIDQVLPGLRHRRAVQRRRVRFHFRAWVRLVCVRAWRALSWQQCSTLPCRAATSGTDAASLPTASGGGSRRAAAGT